MSGHPSLSTLLPHHRDDLLRSGLSPATIECWGCYSIEMDQPWVMQQLGFGHLAPPALVLPILPPDQFGPDLNNAMLKPDVPRQNGSGHPCKYEARPKSRNRIHVPLAIRDKLADISVPLIITEGQKKAEKAAQEGICAVALAGVWNWKDRVGERSFPISDFDLISLAGRRVLICFDSDAASNSHVRQAERDLAAYLVRRFGSRVSIKRLPPGPDGSKVGLDDFLLACTSEQFWQLPEQEIRFTLDASSEPDDWPDPQKLNDSMRQVEKLNLALLPASFRPLIEDVAERMQAPPDYAAAAAIVTLAGCVNRRARIVPKQHDSTWSVVPKLWGACIAPPGFMKSPTLQAIMRPLSRIEEGWREEFKWESRDYEIERETGALKIQVWKEEFKRAQKKEIPSPERPKLGLAPPTQKRLLVQDPTYEKLHEILADNPAGVILVRDELPGWLSGLERQGREQERAFYLESWNGDSGFTIDRIGRGSIHVPAVCVSLFGNIQPARLRYYLSDVLSGGAGDDGLFQRFQVLVWPDLPRDWKYVDRPPRRSAALTAENCLVTLAKLSPDQPTNLRFDPDAQQLFCEWLKMLEGKVRSEYGLPAPMVGHLSKYRSLMPTLAGLFELADSVASGSLMAQMFISLDHARQAAALCSYLESHAMRAYSSVESQQQRSAKELAKKIQARDVPGTFKARDVYLKGWVALSDPQDVKNAIAILEDLGWLVVVETPSGRTGGAPSREAIVNPKVYQP